MPMPTHTSAVAPEYSTVLRMAARTVSCSKKMLWKFASVRLSSDSPRPQALDSEARIRMASGRITASSATSTE